METILKIIFSTGFAFTIIRVATPLIFASLAALISSKAGVMCIALEGIMLFSALGGVVGSAFTSSAIGGIVVGILFGLAIMMIFAYFVLVLDANSIITGLALNILGSGGTVFLLFLISGDKGSSTNLKSLSLPNIKIPIIESIPVLGKILSGHNILTYLAIIMVIFAYFFVNRTALGLRIRSVGENSHAAESVGINVKKTQIIALIVSGTLCAFGGIYMSMAYLPFFTRDMIAGRGFMAIAAQNLGGGSVIPTVLATLFFGFAESLSNTMQSLKLPSQIMQMVPYVATLIGLFFTGNQITGAKKKTATDENKEAK